jgi:hypothetical protein
MKSVKANRLLAFAPILLAVSTAAPEPGSGQEGKSSEAVAVREVTVVGRNYCLGCALKRSEGAAAQCSQYGHRHAVEVESARGPDGQPIPHLAGQSLHYLDNDRSAPLVSGEEHHGERVEIKGRLFEPQRTLEVAEVKPAGAS